MPEFIVDAGARYAASFLSIIAFAKYQVRQ
jgi:hypothetical protein